MPDPESDADHVELTVQRMAELHAQHYEKQSALQRRIARLTGLLARPLSLAVAGAIALAWIVANAAAPAFGFQAFDPPPFALLELVATVIALFTTLMILATQAREEEAARHRSQLTLQLASLTEQKIAKVIALLEEQRRDSDQLLVDPTLKPRRWLAPQTPATSSNGSRTLTKANKAFAAIERSDLLRSLRAALVVAGGGVGLGLWGIRAVSAGGGAGRGARLLILVFGGPVGRALILIGHRTATPSL